MSDVYGTVTEITIRWSKRDEEGKVPKAQRAKIVAALKAFDILTMDLIKDAIFELERIYEEGGYTLRPLPDPESDQPLTAR